MLNEEAKKESVVYAYVNEDTEYVDWDILFEDIEQDENIIIYGNRDYQGTNSDILKQFDNLYNDYDLYHEVTVEDLSAAVHIFGEYEIDDDEGLFFESSSENPNTTMISIYLKKDAKENEEE